MAHPKIDIARQVAKEHEELNQNIDELKIAIMETISEKDFPDWRIQFIGRLRDLKQKLTHHFEFEEQGGFMKEVTEEAPQFFDKVKDLEIEHEQILSHFDGVLIDLEGLREKNDSELQNIFNRLSEIMTNLHQHEMAENQLMQSAFYRDLGSPD